MKESRVLLGMSGGTDSSVSAAILKNQGFHVIGVTFLFSNLENENKQNITDAKEIAESLNINHHILDLREEFNEKIIIRFIKEYSEGKTPFPCAFCNPQLKFNRLYKLATELNCDYISTGHYARIIKHNKLKYISKANDPEKDQSFFLWGLEKHIIERLIFPLGEFTKNQIREYAKHNGFTRIAKKKDSLGICFINSRDYRNYLKNNGLEMGEGNFKDRAGKILGTHGGIMNYTIGQRRGLGINFNKPLFVTEINADKNEIILGDFNQLYKNRIVIKDTHFIDLENIREEKTFIVKIRYRLQDTPCKIRILEKNNAEIFLLEPLAMVAKGQTAVFYENERVIGGGFIKSSE